MVCLHGSSLLFVEYQSITCFEKVIEIQPNNPSYLYALGYVLSELGNLEDAIEIFYLVIKLEPQDALTP